MILIAKFKTQDPVWNFKENKWQKTKLKASLPICILYLWILDRYLAYVYAYLNHTQTILVMLYMFAPYNTPIYRHLLCMMEHHTHSYSPREYRLQRV